MEHAARREDRLIAQERRNEIRCEGLDIGKMMIFHHRRFVVRSNTTNSLQGIKAYLQIRFI
jgi:hypothetical protein